MQRERVLFSLACSNDCDQFMSRSLEEKNFIVFRKPSTKTVHSVNYVYCLSLLHVGSPLHTAKFLSKFHRAIRKMSANTFHYFIFSV